MQTALFVKLQSQTQYWYHIRSHPGHENDSPPPPPPPSQRKETFGNRSYGGHGSSSSSSSSSTSFNRDSTFFEGVEVGKEYLVDITEMGRQGDGIARVQGFVVFVKNGKVGQKVKVKVGQVGNRYATAVMAS